MEHIQIAANWETKPILLGKDLFGVCEFVCLGCLWFNPEASDETSGVLQAAGLERLMRRLQQRDGRLRFVPDEETGESIRQLARDYQLAFDVLSKR
ncbi:MAG: hypothetical protein ABGZ53_23435, partial [Fuerstiella sp.]